MTQFSDRREAGRQLAARLGHYRGRSDVTVLGIPRGGVPVADEVARALGAPLDLWIAHKIGAPFNRELAIGAVTGDGTVLLDAELIHELRIPRKLVEEARDEELRAVRARAEKLRAGRAPLVLEGRVVILVDDGIATGATTTAGLRALQQHRPARRVLAIPVAPRAVVRQLAKECEELVYLDAPEVFVAVGYFYRDFGQVSDEEVREIVNTE